MMYAENAMLRYERSNLNYIYLGTSTYICIEMNGVGTAL